MNELRWLCGKRAGRWKNLWRMPSEHAGDDAGRLSPSRSQDVCRLAQCCRMPVNIDYKGCDIVLQLCVEVRETSLACKNALSTDNSLVRGPVQTAQTLVLRIVTRRRSRRCPCPGPYPRLRRRCSIKSACAFWSLRLERRRSRRR
jgi:hypothetical protein